MAYLSASYGCCGPAQRGKRRVPFRSDEKLNEKFTILAHLGQQPASDSLILARFGCNRDNKCDFVAVTPTTLNDGESGVVWFEQL
jgi:hypothetical protein